MGAFFNKPSIVPKPIYFIIHKTGCLQRFLKSLVWGIFKGFFLALVLYFCAVFLSTKSVVHKGLPTQTPSLWVWWGVLVSLQSASLPLGKALFRMMEGLTGLFPSPSPPDSLSCVPSVPTLLLHFCNATFSLDEGVLSVLVGSHPSHKPGLEVMI